jgi:hypothetical protein
VSRLSVSYMLDWHTLHLGSKAGWVNVATHLTTAVLTSGIMMAVVRMGGKAGCMCVCVCGGGGCGRPGRVGRDSTNHG